MLNPLLDAGLLPHLDRLINHGVIATLESDQPLVAPVLWTTVATGERARQHGVLHDRVPDPADASGQRDQPAGAAGRLSPTLWERAARAGRRVHVLGWPVTFPAEQTTGVFLAEGGPPEAGDLAGTAARGLPPDRLIPGTSSAPDLADALGELDVSPHEIGLTDLRALVPDLDASTVAADPRVSLLATLLAAAATRHAVGTWVLESEPDWDLALLHYSFLDELGRAFMAYHPPKRRHVSPADFARYRHVVTGACALFDAMLGRLLDLAGEGTGLLLISTRGFLTGNTRPAPGPSEQAEAVDPHRPVGLAVLAGPGVREDERLDRATLVDILPTALTLLGLPVPARLPGRVWQEALVADAPPSTPVPGLDPVDHVSANGALARENFLALSARLLAGHVPSEAPLPPGLAAAWDIRYSLARHLLASGLPAEALPIFEEILRVQPLRAGPEMHRILCLLGLGRTQECHAALETLAARPDGGLRSFGGKRPAHVPQFDFLLGLLALAANQPHEALAHFTAARRARTQVPGLHLELGRVLLRLRRPREAAAAFRRALALDAEDPGPNLGAAWAALRLRRFRVAAERALRAAARAPQNPETHLTLGLALGHLGQRAPALLALRRALALRPGYRVAHRLLARWLRHDPTQAAAADLHALAGRRPSVSPGLSRRVRR